MVCKLGVLYVGPAGLKTGVSRVLVWKVGPKNST